MARFQGLRWPRFNSVKTADIVFADIQGQDALLAQFATSKYARVPAVRDPCPCMHASANMRAHPN